MSVSEAQARKHEQIIEDYKRRAISSNSRKLAIRAFCVECMGGDLAEVRNCCSPNCPLYRFRMGINQHKKRPSSAMFETKTATGDP